MKYNYKSGDHFGNIFTNTIEASSLDEAKRLIFEQGQEILSIEKQKSIAGGFLKNKKNAVNLILITKLFATLLKSGMDILKVLETVMQYSEDESLKYVIKNLYQNVSSGETLASGMRRNSSFFSEYYASSVEAGEVTGNLVVTFETLYIHINAKAKIVKKIKLAMMYPTFLICFALVVVIFMSVFVMPTFAGVYSSFGKKLPFITQFILNISYMVRHYWYIIFIIVVAVFMFMKKRSSQERLRKILSKLVLKQRKLREFVYIRESVSVFRTLNLAIKSGIPLLGGLELAKKNIANDYIRKDFDVIIENVANGEKISESFKRVNFPSLAVQMLYIGENSNQLEDMLESISELYEEEIERALMTLMAFIEPVMILFVGVLIGTMVIAMILPILTLSSAVSG
ncbi:MAG: type II secretion system F family protein [Fusobacteria bacterium]|nr:type II secretion system F family protein [Fusobacteriota bacterium]